MKRLIEHYNRRRDVYSALLNALAALGLIASVLATAFLCCVCSGYRWE